MGRTNLLDVIDPDASIITAMSRVSILLWKVFLLCYKLGLVNVRSPLHELVNNPDDKVEMLLVMYCISYAF
jgi:hypothetical protein